MMGRDRIDDLWKSVNRVDLYITSSNFRTALLLTFNVALFGSAFQIGFFSGADSILDFLVISFYFVFSALGLVYSLFAVFPNVKSTQDGPFYFVGLSNDSKAVSAKEFLKESTDDQLFDSLFEQYKDISRVAERKFHNHKRAVTFIQVSIFFFLTLSFLKIFFE